jgi:hypothetical protein
MMNGIFQDLITEGVVSVYLNDILIFTNSLEEHRRITCLVLYCMHEHKLYLRPEKCKFERTRIEYLGIIISHNKVEMDPVKIAGVADWPTPSNQKEVQSFVGFVNFYQCFIPGFSHHARALFDLTMKDIRFIWGLPQEDSFMKLKELVTSAPVLILPNNDLPFRLEVDGSGIATGAVLSQHNVWHPITFLSKVLNPVERNYEMHDTEMLAIIRGLEEWRHYLEGAMHPVEIWTDHKNLEYFQVAQKLNRRQACWSLYLSCFDFTLHHKPGRSMGKPDALSRWADHGSGQGDNDNLTLLAPELFRIHVLAGARFQGEEQNILQEVQCSLKDGVQEESIAKAARELQKDKGRGTVKSAEWSERGGGYSCSAARSMSPMTETCGIVSSNSTMIHASPDMQATLRPLSWYPTIIGGHRCPIISASMLSTAICATGLKYNDDDPSASSIPQRLLKHHGT